MVSHQVEVWADDERPFVACCAGVSCIVGPRVRLAVDFTGGFVRDVMEA